MTRDAWDARFDDFWDGVDLDDPAAARAQLEALLADGLVEESTNRPAAEHDDDEAVDDDAETHAELDRDQRRRDSPANRGKPRAKRHLRRAFVLRAILAAPVRDTLKRAGDDGGESPPSSG